MNNSFKKARWLGVIVLVGCLLFVGQEAWAAKKLTVIINDGTSGNLLSEAQWKLSSESSWRTNNTDVALQDGAYKVNFNIPDGYGSIPDEDVNITNEAVTLIVSTGTSMGGQVSNWPLWPIKPSVPYDSIVFDPLSFTIVGSDRNYLSWSEPIFNDGSVWGGIVYLSDLDTSVTTTTDSSGVFGTRDMGIWPNVDEGKKGLDSLASEDVGVFPEYVANWVTVSGDTAFVDVPNQEVIGDWLSAWRSFLAENDKGGEGSSYIGDTGHASPTMIYADNVWIADMSGYRSYKTFLKGAYALGDWGDAILLVPTNEGLLHAFTTNTFKEKWAITPFPGQGLGYYQQARKVASGADEEPRMNLLDGPLGFADIEGEAEGTWRRLVVGTAGTGITLANKPAEYYSSEYLADESSDTTEALASNLTAQYAAISRNNPHFWGIYAVNLADNGSDISPSDPVLLWSVSTVYFEEDDSEKGTVFVNGVRYDRNNDDTQGQDEVPDGYKGFQDIRLSCARPVIGMTEDDGNRQWHVVFVGISHEEEFHLYDLDAETGEILEDINLGNFPMTVYQDGVGTALVEDRLSDSLGGNNDISDIIWDERFEWKFPTRIGAIAKDKIRDQDPDNLGYAQLYTRPLLKEVYVHLSNGSLYRWDVSKPPSQTNPVMVALSVYQNDYTFTDSEGTEVENNALVSGPSTQDFDGTYLTPLDYVEGESSTEYHRFLALVLKGGDDSNEAKVDIRGLAVLDVDNIVASDKVFLISTSNTWGHGNQDTVDYYADDLGWFTILAAGNAAEGKFWNEVLTVSAPVFIDGRIVLAGYQPDTNTSWIYNVDAQPGDGTVITDDEIPFTDTEFGGGATINNSGPDGQAVIYVATSDGTTVSQDIEGVRWETGVGDGSSGSHVMEILYWKTN